MLLYMDCSAGIISPLLSGVYLGGLHVLQRFCLKTYYYFLSRYLQTVDKHNPALSWRSPDHDIEQTVSDQLHKYMAVCLRVYMITLHPKLLTLSIYTTHCVNNLCFIKCECFIKTYILSSFVKRTKLSKPD